MPAPYWTTYPEVDPPGRGSPRRGADHLGGRVQGHGGAAGGGPDGPRPRCCCSCRPPTRPERSTRPTRSRPSVAGRSSNGIWVVTDEIYEHLVYGDARFSSMPVLVPELADTCVVDQRRGQDLRHDRVAGRLDDRPHRRDRSRRQPAVPRHLQRVQRGPAGRPGRRERRPRGGGRDAGDLRPPPAHHRRHAQRHPRRALSRTPGRVLRLPERGRPAGPALRGAGRRSTSLELAALVLDEARVAFVPGEAFGAPGYARFSYALGDEALVEGITRLAKFVAG